MTKSMAAGLFALALLHGVLSDRARAQAGSACTTWVGNGGVVGYVIVPPPGPVFNCESEGPYLIICQVMTAQCAPPDAGPETEPTCNSSKANPSAGHPICLASGNTFVVEKDIAIPGLGGGLSLVRTWNSLWPSTQSAFQTGLFGPNWRSNFEERVFAGSDNYMKYARGDGSFWSFGVGGPGWSVAAPANAGATLVPGASYWTLTFQNGEQRLFDNASGHLISVIDRNGNTTQVSYDAGGRLNTVTDPASRHLYFSYANGSSLLVTGVTSDTGLSLSYAYDTQGRLIQVTNPDATTYTFQYNTQSLISSVTDQNGKILESHTYDSSGRGLTSSRANGVDAVTVSYGSN
jgi:YD repeat-containing protein